MCGYYNGTGVLPGKLAADALHKLSGLGAVDFITAKDIGQSVEHDQLRPERIQEFADLSEAVGELTPIFLVERHQKVVEPESLRRYAGTPGSSSQCRNCG